MTSNYGYQNSTLHCLTCSNNLPGSSERLGVPAALISLLGIHAFTAIHSGDLPAITLALFAKTKQNRNATTRQRTLAPMITKRLALQQLTLAGYQMLPERQSQQEAARDPDKLSEGPSAPKRSRSVGRPESGSVVPEHAEPTAIIYKQQRPTASNRSGRDAFRLHLFVKRDRQARRLSVISAIP